jgi:hypothetical protein
VKSTRLSGRSVDESFAGQEGVEIRLLREPEAITYDCARRRLGTGHGGRVEDDGVGMWGGTGID